MIKPILASLMLAICAPAAQAVPVALTFEGNISTMPTPKPTTAGERFTLTLMVDNGGTSSASQIWTAAHFLSFRVQGATGWWIEAQSIRQANSTGSFATDARGAITSVGTWGNGGNRQPALAASGSWSWLRTGSWRVSSDLAMFFSSSQTDGVTSSSWYIDNADAFGVAENWKASVVPVPASLPLLAAGLGALALMRRKTRKA